MKTEFELFLGGGSVQATVMPTDTALIFNVTNGTTLGSGRIEFYVKLSGGQYLSTNHNISQDGVVEETFNYVGGTITDLWYVDQVADYIDRD